MTDAPEGPPRASPSAVHARTPRVDGGGSPVGSTLSIVLAVIAVIAGFLILRAITDDDGDSGVPPDDARRRSPTTRSGRPSADHGGTDDASSGADDAGAVTSRRHGRRWPTPAAIAARPPA